MSDFILQRQGSGFYGLIANPTSAQISQFNLTTPASIGYELADINLDGAVDMVLLGSSGAGGIVYAPTSSQSAPIAYKHVDEEFVEFFTALSQALLNPEYFDNSAQENGWGQWVPYGPVSSQLSWWDSSLLYLSGQPFQPALLPPHPEPQAFYQNLSQAFDGTVQPSWCAINGQGSYEFANGVWMVLGKYREVSFVPNQDIVEVASVLSTYLNSETPAAIPALIFQILEEILGVNHNIDGEPDIFNLIRIMGEIYFGLGVEQEVTLPLLLAKVELLYTDINYVPTFERHTYIQVTFPNGNKYVTAGWPRTQSVWPFVYLLTEWFLNPTSSEDFEDYGKPIYFRQLVGHTAFTEQMISAGMASTSAYVNSCQIPYWLLVDNSNSYAFQAIQPITGLARPRPVAHAPGAYSVIPCP